MEWIKFYTGKWLYGSGRVMTPEKRGVWADLLALAGETKFRDGSLRFEVDCPMPRDYIAGVLKIDKGLLDTCIEAFKADINLDDGTPRIQIWDDGTIFLTKFLELQGKPSDNEKPIKPPLSQDDRDKMTVRNVVKNPQLGVKGLNLTDKVVVDPNTGEVLEDSEVKAQKDKVNEQQKTIGSLEVRARGDK